MKVQIFCWQFLLFQKAGIIIKMCQKVSCVIWKIMYRELFKWLKVNGYLVTQAYPGIYYVEKEGMFPIQIIVGAQLNRKNHLWLKSLSQKMTETDVEKLVLQVAALSDLGDRSNAEAILQVSITENKDLFRKVVEERELEVNDALMELMKPRIDEVVKEAVDNNTKETAKETSVGMVRKLFNQGVSYELCRASIDSDVISDEELQAIYNKTLE